MKSVLRLALVLTVADLAAAVLAYRKDINGAFERASTAEIAAFLRNAAK